MGSIAHTWLRFLFLITSDPLKRAELWRRRGVNVGSGTHIYRDVNLGRGGKDPISIGRNCVLTGCAIIGHDASTNAALGLLPGERSPVMPVVIEDDCFIGYGAIILMGVRVGRGSIVGAGAIVTKDVPPGSVVGGNPAKVICTVQHLVQRRLELARDHPECFPTAPRVSDQGDARA